MTPNNIEKPDAQTEASAARCAVASGSAGTRYRDGGYVGNGPPVDVSLYDRAWWKCSKCGALFEAYETPPKHFCALSPNTKISRDGA